MSETLSSLLTDAQMRDYLKNGYVLLNTTTPTEIHQSIYDKTDAVFGSEGNPGNNVLPRVPALRQVFDDPAVSGALTSVLGPDYVMHSHRHPHINVPKGKGGGWHKDSYWGYYKVRCHRSRWAMIFYYPQDVTNANGPTAVIPGTQYLMNRVEDESSEVQTSVLGKAGTCALVHFDIWHRAMPNTTDVNRYMMKFQFRRMSEPQQPSWNSTSTKWRRNEVDPMDIVSEQMWDWHCGRRDGVVCEEDASDLAKALQSESETIRLDAAYKLGAVGQDGVSPLMGTMKNGDESIQLAAAYGLSVNTAAVDALVENAGHPEEHVRKFVAYALGEQGTSAGSAGVDALAHQTEDPSVEVRRAASEALGTVECYADVAVPALISFLRDEDPQVRFNAAYSVSSFGADAAEAVPALNDALNDDNRYVSGHTVSALRAIGTPEAEVALLDYLSVSRWCSSTTKESTF